MVPVLTLKGLRFLQERHLYHPFLVHPWMLRLLHLGHLILLPHLFCSRYSFAVFSFGKRARKSYALIAVFGLYVFIPGNIEAFCWHLHKS